jgi:hypothetical protein
MVGVAIGMKLLLIVYLYMCGLCWAGQAVFIKPLTDAFPNKLSMYGKNFKEQSESSLFSWDTVKVACWMSCGQVLFNEICEVYVV